MAEFIEFQSTDKKYLKKGDKDILTLYTCEKDLLSSSNKRIGCICDLKKREFYKEAEVKEDTDEE